ncbi:type II secretion system secretin GspD [Salinicola aestuarinus]|uniref:type II secretion system secretin GspD n=1 Tax=Salinicola aestuarinus TaxID=1949082 RepID=UPI000DA1F039|nr:type II secretion system secretin GspD [Salinicola aestuarinus]
MTLRPLLGRILLAVLVATFTASVQAQTAAEASDARYTVDFDNVSLPDFIQSIGRITGRDFVVDPRVRGEISLTSQRALTADELYRVFQNELQVNGFATVALADGRVRVVPDQVARTQPLPVGGGDGQSIATRVIETQSLDAATLSTIIEPLVDARVGAVSAYPNSNLLVVTDWQDNLDRLTQLAARLDSRRDTEAEVIPVNYAAADELAETLDGVMQENGSATRIVASPSGQGLVAYGPARERARLRRLVTSLDTPTSTQTNTRVVYLNHGSAEAVVNVLRSLRDGGDFDTGVSHAAIGADEARPALAGDDPVEQSRLRSPSGTAGGGVGGEVSFAVYPETNALVLTGPSSRLDAVEAIVKRLDVRRAQVAVEAIIAEISESRARELGLQWLFADTSGSGSVPIGSVNFPVSGNPGINDIAAAAISDDTSALGSLLGGLDGITAGVGRLSDSGISFAALLNALRSDTSTNLLSTPSLMTLDNAEAYILVGQEVPFVTGSTTLDNANPYQTIQREDVGIKLNIRPSISADNTIRMEIGQEVSSIANNVDASDVVTNKREIETTVVTQDGGMVVLGGLISNNTSSTQQSVPLLGDIPLVGNLFRYTSNENERQNLMVFIRARVLRDGQPLDAATAEKYQYMRAQQVLQKLDADQQLPPLETMVEGNTGAGNLSNAPQGASTASASWQQLYPSARDRLGSLAP